MSTWERSVFCGLICIAIIVCMVTGCARVNGYRIETTDIPPTVQETRTDRISEARWLILSDVTPQNIETVTLQLAGNREISRVEISKQKTERIKVYLHDDRGEQILELTVMLGYLGGTVPIVDLLCRLLGGDGFTGWAVAKYEELRPNYFIRLWHWNGWFTFISPIYAGNKTTKVIKSEIQEYRKNLPSRSLYEVLPSYSANVTISDARTGTGVYRESATTDREGKVTVDLKKALATVSPGTSVQLFIACADLGGGWRVNTYTRVKYPPFLVPAKDLAAYRERESKIDTWNRLSAEAEEAVKAGDLKRAVAALDKAHLQGLGGGEPQRRLAAIYRMPEWQALKPKVTVQTFEVSRDLSPGLGKTLCNWLIGELTNSQRYTIVDWVELDSLLQHIAKSQPLLSTEDAKKQAINQRGVSQIFVGSLYKIGSKYYLNVKALNLDLSVAGSFEDAVTSEDQLQQCVKNVATQIMYSARE